ncbi:MAG TPA: hypothetical protein VGG92_03065 [Caulobacteraceae bacterium]|jgi:hypothetical protein
MYADPFIDVDEWRDAPVRHRYVHGGFKDSELLFSLYFPPKEAYGGRFFQPLQAVSGSENSAPMSMNQAFGFDFAIASGGYLVESNQGARNMFGGSAEANAAVAQYSRTIAVEMYGPHRPYGYVYGGSGGAFKTLGCVENFADVWDGSIPFVHGTPVSIPYFFTVQAHAMRVLGPKFPQIVEALEPGGSGDMYAGLTGEEADALREVTRFGFPPRAWFNFRRIAFGYTGVFTTLVDRIVDGDPTYFDDFWTKPGYLGFDPPESLAKARVQHATRIGGLIMPDEARALGLPLTMATAQTQSGVSFPAALKLEDLPPGNLQGAAIRVLSGGAEGHQFYVAGVVRDAVMIGFGQGHFQAMAQLKVGDEVVVDNSIYLATQTYHRHQIPSPEYPAWDQYKGPDGEPLYPQRPLLPGPESLSGGATQNGQFHGKMIVMQALLDEAAYPWSGAWYRKRVEAALGPEIDDRYRLWFVENAMHTTQAVAPGEPRPVATTRVISYQGVLQQALRDLAAWVEQDIAPPLSSGYRVEDGQVVLAASAADRKGVQPVVTLTANGGAKALVKVGETVEFEAVVEAPPGAGVIAAVDWDFEGAGDFSEESDLGSPSPHASMRKTYAFAQSGTYFPAVRASVRRAENDSLYARPKNLGRVRVVVT